MQLVVSPTLPDVLSFRSKTNSRLIGSRQAYVPCDFIHYWCLGWRNRKRREYWRAARPNMYFSTPFWMSGGQSRRFNIDILLRYARYCAHVFRGQYARRTRVNYSYAYAKLPKVFSQFHWRRAWTSIYAAGTTMHALESLTVDLCCLLPTYVRALRMSAIHLRIYMHADLPYI